MGGENYPDTPVYTGQLFDGNSISENIPPHTAIFFRIRQAEPAFACNLLDHIIRKFIVLVKSEGNRFHFRLCKGANLFAKRFMRFRSLK